MRVTGKPEAEGQPRDVFTTWQINERTVEPQSHAVATERHAFRPREGVSKVSFGHLNYVCDFVEQHKLAYVRVQP